MSTPMSSYSVLVTHICPKVDSPASIDPPIQAELPRSGTEITLGLVPGGKWGGGEGGGGKGGGG